MCVCRGFVDVTKLPSPAWLTARTTQPWEASESRSALLRIKKVRDHTRRAFSCTFNSKICHRCTHTPATDHTAHQFSVFSAASWLVCASPVLNPSLVICFLALWRPARSSQEQVKSEWRRHTWTDTRWEDSRHRDCASRLKAECHFLSRSAKSDRRKRLTHTPAN